MTDWREIDRNEDDLIDRYTAIMRERAARLRQERARGKRRPDDGGVGKEEGDEEDDDEEEKGVTGDEEEPPLALKAFDPNQPRVPKGQEGGGRWVRVGTAVMPEAAEGEAHEDESRRGMDSFISLLASNDREPAPGNDYSTEGGLLKDQGRYCEPAPLPKGTRRGRTKLCYMNAFKLADSTGLDYYEGYAEPDIRGLQPGMLQVSHAWVVDPKTNRVLDNTWPEPGRAYFGVKIPIDTLREVQLATGTYGVLGSLYNREVASLVLKKPGR